MLSTITDAYAHLERLHGAATPERTLEQLRDEIHNHGFRYEELGQVFWDHLFDGEANAWVYTGECPGEIDPYYLTNEA